MFRDPTDKQLEALSRALFSLVGPTLLILALTLLDGSKSLKRDPTSPAVDPSLIENIELMVVTLKSNLCLVSTEQNSLGQYI